MKIFRMFERLKSRSGGATKGQDLGKQGEVMNRTNQSAAALAALDKKIAELNTSKSPLTTAQQTENSRLQAERKALSDKADADAKAEAAANE